LWRRLRASSALGVVNHRLRRALAAGDIPALVAAIAELAASPTSIRPDDVGVREVMVNAEQAVLAIARGGSVSQLDAAIAACQQAADGAPSPLITAPFQAWRGTLLAVMFDKTHDMAHLDAAISAFAQAAETVPETQPVRAGYLDRLAKLRSARSLLAEAEAEDEREERVRHIALEGSELLDQGIQARDPATLTAAVARLRQARDLTPAEDPRRLAIISDIGVALRHRFELTGALADLDDAVAAQREAVEAAPADDTRRAAYLSNLSTVLRIRFERAGAGADLDEAADVSRKVLESCGRRSAPRRGLVRPRPGAARPVPQRRKPRHAR
jgi:tetratricopeptide (TPR) repeat protein